MESIFRRRSVRQFQDIKVEDEKIETILKAGMTGPSTINQQPWEFYVTTNKETLLKLSNCSPYASFVKNAAVAFIPCYRADVKAIDYAQIDLAIATQNMLLTIDHLGLGAVFIGVAPSAQVMDYVSDVLNLPDNLKPFSIVPCGYSASEGSAVDRYDASRVHFLD